MTKAMVMAAVLAAGMLAARADEAIPAVRWRGFNLTGMISSRDGRRPDLREEDFRLIRDLGFNFARLPLDYRFWTKNGNPEEIDEKGFAPLDRAVDWGRRYGVHVQIALHRIPGYTVASEPEPRSIFRDAGMRNVACRHWAFIARRYRDRPNAEVSFNLMNEPALVDDATCSAVCRALIDAIRNEDPRRFIVADGLEWGRVPIRGLYGIPGVGQATRGYDPKRLTHYLASWADTPKERPRWPVNPDSPCGLLQGPGAGAEHGVFRLHDVPAGEIELTFGKVMGPSRLEVRGDGHLIGEIRLAPQEGPDWTEAKYYDRWKVWQAIPREPKTVAVPKAVRLLTLESVEGDWCQLTRLGCHDRKGRGGRLKFATERIPPRNFEWRFLGRKDRPFECVKPVKWRYPGHQGMEYLYRTWFHRWDEAVTNGTWTMAGEFGVVSTVPHPIALRLIGDYLALWKERNMGWAMWELRGTMGVLDSERKDVDYEDFHGHKLDRKMLELLQAN